MFESLLYDEEGLLVLNLKQLEADYVSGRYKLNPYGQVYVSCPTGYYPLFAYLSRIAGMKDAREALKKFRAEKMAVLDREAYTTIKLQRENELEDLLRRSFYYYYYADADQIRSTDKFLEAFQENVYNNEYDYNAFCEGVMEDIHENPEKWEQEQKAFIHGLERMQNNEHCDSVDAAKEAVKEAAVYLGKTDIPADNRQKYVFEQAAGLFYVNCIGIVAERYASPVYALPEFARGEPIDSIVGRMSVRKDAEVAMSVYAEDIESVYRFITSEAAKMDDCKIEDYYVLACSSAEKTLRKKRAYVKSEDLGYLNQREYGDPDYDFGGR
jgi:hypothetical protein